MLEKLRSLLFEPQYPQRYIGRHRLQPGRPVLMMTAMVTRSLNERNA